jgi:hypothetical protein
MATTTSLSKNRPLLESVFGAITDAEDSEIRQVFGCCDEILLALAKHFGHGRAGWEGTGLELTMMPSEQASISSFVETSLDGDGAKCVSFCVELRPGWYNGDKSDTGTWEAGAEIYADCQHKTDHRAMHLVRELPALRKSTPKESANALLSVVQELDGLARLIPLEEWLRTASDKD